MTKWVHRPHWELAGVLLGADELGEWIGFPVGTPASRPGASLETPNLQVSLVPTSGTDVERGWVATFHAPGGSVLTYVDITTPPVWDGATLRCVDLDLDVVRALDGTVYVDDEDEFEEHQVALGYPLEVVDLATASCASVLAAMQAARAPYDGSADAWLRRLAERVA